MGNHCLCLTLSSSFYFLLSFLTLSVAVRPTLPPFHNPQMLYVRNKVDWPIHGYVHLSDFPKARQFRISLKVVRSCPR